MKRILVVAAALAWASTALAQVGTQDVARRAVLYEEGAGQDDKAEGQVTWRTERTADPSAPPGDVTIRGDVVIPSRGARMTVSFRRNFNSSLSASHTVQVDFKPPLDFAGGSVKQVMGLMLKTTEQAKGIPLDALSVKIDDMHFLIGMSGVAKNASANQRLVRSRDWIDIPLFYGTQRRAILAIAKDGDAAAMFNKVFAD